MDKVSVHARQRPSPVATKRCRNFWYSAMVHPWPGRRPFGTTFGALRSAVTGRTPAILFPGEGAEAQRNPLLLFLFSGLLLLRYAARKLSGLLLFHEPPRTTRLNLRPTEGDALKERRPQSPGIRVRGMPNPGHDTLLYL